MGINARLLGLDVGERRIGVAYCDGTVTIALPLTTLVVDGTEKAKLQAILQEKQITEVVVGRPRNQSGEATAQTIFAEKVATQLLEGADVQIHWQDESLTSVMAEERLQTQTKDYEKADIDMQAAAIILQDFLEDHYGHH